jgi:hypothetical protein
VDAYIKSTSNPWHEIKSKTVTEITINGESYAFIEYKGTGCNADGWETWGISDEVILKCDGSQKQIRDYGIIGKVQKVITEIRHLKAIKLIPKEQLQAQIDYLNTLLNFKFTIKEVMYSDEEESKRKQREDMAYYLAPDTEEDKKFAKMTDKERTDDVFSKLKKIANDLKK